MALHNIVAEAREDSEGLLQVNSFSSLMSNLECRFVPQNADTFHSLWCKSLAAAAEQDATAAKSLAAAAEQDATAAESRAAAAEQDATAAMKLFDKKNKKIEKAEKRLKQATATMMHFETKGIFNQKALAAHAAAKKRLERRNIKAAAAKKRLERRNIKAAAAKLVASAGKSHAAILTATADAKTAAAKDKAAAIMQCSPVQNKAEFVAKEGWCEQVCKEGGMQAACTWVGDKRNTKPACSCKEAQSEA